MMRPLKVRPSKTRIANAHLVENDDKEQRIKYRSIHPIILMYHRQLLLCFTLRNSTFTMVANHCFVHNTFANILIIFESTN